RGRSSSGCRFDKAHRRRESGLIKQLRPFHWTLHPIHLLDPTMTDAATGLAPAVFSESSPIVVKAIHSQELRTALTEARNAIGLPVLTYTDSTLTSGAVVKAVH